MTTTALLSTTYFGPVQWYQKLHRYGRTQLEVHETFAKQTYRNRCIIATAQGTQALTVPVSPGDDHSILKVKISDHGNWRHLHWQAITSAYGDAPFLEYYEDDLRPFFTERRWEFLVDFNEDITRKMCDLIDIHPHLTRTDKYRKSADFIDAYKEDVQVTDFRNSIQPKHPGTDSDFEPRPYYQVFSRRHGFLPNLSILDLLLNMGPEAIFYL